MTKTEIMTKFIRTDNGEIQVPDNEAEKIELSRDLFGSTLINNIDYWLDIAKDLIDNNKPQKPFERENEASKQDKLYRDTFAKLDLTTKEIIFKLIHSTTSGVIYSTLLDIDRYDFGDINISFNPKTADTTDNIKITSPQEEELHIEYYNWVDKFSKHKEALLS